jgi:hypothetical protein
MVDKEATMVGPCTPAAFRAIEIPSHHRRPLRLATLILMQQSRQVFIAMSALMACTAIGCGKSGPTMYHVSGKISFKNGTMPHGGVSLVSFVPTKDGSGEGRRPATGPIGPDGSFAMYTRVDGDGVVAGDYNVLIAILKGPMERVSLLPAKYFDMSSPPFKATVDRNISDLDYPIDMTGAPVGK